MFAFGASSATPALGMARYPLGAAPDRALDNLCPGLRREDPTVRGGDRPSIRLTQPTLCSLVVKGASRFLTSGGPGLASAEIADVVDHAAKRIHEQPDVSGADDEIRAGVEEFLALLGRRHQAAV